MTIKYIITNQDDPLKAEIKPIETNLEKDALFGSGFDPSIDLFKTKEAALKELAYKLLSLRQDALIEADRQVKLADEYLAKAEAWENELKKETEEVEQVDGGYFVSKEDADRGKKSLRDLWESIDRVRNKESKENR